MAPSPQLACFLSLSLVRWSAPTDSVQRGTARQPPPKERAGPTSRFRECCARTHPCCQRGISTAAPRLPGGSRGPRTPLSLLEIHETSTAGLNRRLPSHCQRPTLHGELPRLPPPKEPRRLPDC